MKDVEPSSWLEAQRVEFRAHDGSRASIDLRVERGTTCLQGCSCLLDALVDPSLIRSGSLQLAAMAPSRALASGKVGFAPTHLPAPSSAKLEQVLSMSTRLVGASGSSARLALERCGLGGVAQKTMGQLSPLEQRLSGIAHAIALRSPMIVLARPFYRLSEEDRARVMDVLLRLDVEWLARTEANCPISSELQAQAQHLVVLDPSYHAGLQPVWIQSAARDTLTELLRSEAQLRVHQAPHPAWLLVEGSTKAEIVAFLRAHHVTADSVEAAEDTPYGYCRRD